MSKSEVGHMNRACFRWLRFFRVAEAARRRLPTPEARHRRQAHPDVSVTGATECCDRFNGPAPTIDWWHSVSGTGLLVEVS